MEKTKIIRDSVHGYIDIPKSIADDFVDTEIFQRLRKIEQTSMRVLYPSARHDRFIHSLGTYHLACKASKAIKTNSKDILEVIPPQKLEEICKTFELASLLHDCGHAPFSHSCEDYYDDEHKTCLKRILIDEIKTQDSDFEQELVDCAAHEKVSSIVLLRHFRKQLNCHGADPILAVRMITGSTYNSSDNDKLIKNCFIQLLNGSAIDVDKLDYIIRDTWASGVANVSIDIERLISAYKIVKVYGKLRPGFNKSAASVIKSVIDGRNFLYNWIYSHHKVLYDKHLLEKIISGLICQISLKTKKHSSEVQKSLFSIQAFNEKVELFDDMSLYLTDDSDLEYIMKVFIDQVESVRERISRNYKKYPLWKSYAEFKALFSEIGDRDIERFLKFSRDQIGVICNTESLDFDEHCVFREVSDKTTDLMDNDIYIEIESKPISYKKLFEFSGIHGGNFFIVYLSEKLLEKKPEIIHKLKDFYQ